MTLQFANDDKKIADLRKKEEEELLQSLSGKYGIPYANLAAVAIDPEALRVLAEAKARAAHIGIFDAIGKKVKIGVATPDAPETLEAIAELEGRGYDVSRFLISHTSLEKVWSRYKDLSLSTETQAGSLDISNDEIAKIVREVTTIEEIKSRVDEVVAGKQNYRISRILEILLAGSLAVKASDVHIEPEENLVRVRFRLDGVLHDILSFDASTYRLLLSRIKLLSGLKLNVKENAQDGRFSIKLDAEEIEVRTSVLPGSYGESIVMRILNPNSIGVSMEKLGMRPRLLALVEHEISKPNGMVLVTGPTGSGKTTSLYAFLKKVHTSDVKIITIEDPIEYHLEGIVQTQTNTEKGYTFLSGLRSVLRQDPDILMVGEIRDAETAEIAVNSALTGHLVFSTLHTNNAAGAIPRLIDLGVNPKIISSALTITLAQRLVRTLCQNCKKEAPIDAAKKEIITKILNTLPEGIEKPQSEHMYEAVGCEQCGNTGFKGRIGVFEAIKMDANIEALMKDSVSEREIAEVARSQGIPTMKEDGILKILEGVTTFSEVERVIEIF